MIKNSLGKVYSIGGQIIADTQNGHGSTNNKIRRWTNVNIIGTAITYADSAANGGTFTINEAGIYFISYNDGAGSGNCYYGISLNSSQLTTVIQSITTANCLMAIWTTSAGTTPPAVATIRLAVGDVIRAHTDRNPNYSTPWNKFIITQVAKL